MPLSASPYDSHLAGVSRSFAACIAELAEPLRGWIGLSYLLCRVLDTIEDTPWQQADDQTRCFLQFDQFVAARPTPALVRQWTAWLPGELDAAEAALVRDAPALLCDLHALPRAPRRRLQATLRHMSAGMRRFACRGNAQAGVRLANRAALDRYCFVVAGVVGLLLLDLLALTTPAMRVTPQSKHDAVHFGLLLQKINVLKDQAADERAGRFLVPDRAAVVSQLGQHARFAARFVLRVPSTAQGFRRFCAWSLFLAAHSLPTIQQLAGGKLPRPRTEALFVSVAELCRSNVALRAGLRSTLAALPPGPSATEAARVGDAKTFCWLRAVTCKQQRPIVARALSSGR